MLTVFVTSSTAANRTWPLPVVMSAMPNAPPGAGSTWNCETNFPLCVNSTSSLDCSGSALTASPVRDDQVAVGSQHQRQRPMQMRRILVDHLAGSGVAEPERGIMNRKHLVICRRGHEQRVGLRVEGQTGRAQEQRGRIGAMRESRCDLRLIQNERFAQTR